LRRAELGGPSLAGQCVTLRRRRAFATWFALHGGNEPERAAGSRAVVVGDPQRQLDERGRQLLDNPFDRDGVDPGRRVDIDVRDDRASSGVAESDFDDRAPSDAVGDLVGELTRERACGDERIDGGVPSDRASLDPARDAGSSRRPLR
jgi:hypothetical protein